MSKSRQPTRRGRARSTAAPTPRSGRSERGMPAAVLLLAATLAAYLTSFWGGFVFDDMQNIVNNPEIRSLDDWRAVLFGSRRPLVQFTLAVNYAQSGLEHWSYHFTNLAIHAAAGLVLFALLRRTLRLPRFKHLPSGYPSGLALVVALLWLIHPLQTQSVTYIVQRGESLMGLCYLLTLYAALRGVQAARPAGWFALAILSCAAGMASKAVMVTAPLVVLLYDWVFLTKHPRDLLKRWPLYVGLLACWGVLAAVGVLRGVLAPDPSSPATVGFGVDEITPWEYLRSQPGVLLHYLRLVILPAGQVLDYAWPVAESTVAIFVPGVLVLLLLGLTVVGVVRRRALGFVGAWFFLVLAPTSSIVPIRDLAYEHRMYLPLAAVLVVVAVGIDWLLRRAGLPGRQPRLVAVVLVATLLTGVTAARNLVYRSPMTMWTDVVRKAPHNGRAWNNLSTARRESGDVAGAIEAGQRAVELDPANTLAQFNLAQAYARAGHFGEAIPHFEAARVAEPENAEVLRLLARCYGAVDRLDDALAALDAALAAEPRAAKLYAERARALGNNGKPVAALADFRRALQQDPSDDALRQTVAGLARDLAQLEQLRNRAAAQPDDLNTRSQLALLLAGFRQFDAAVAECQAILSRDPQHRDARQILAQIRALQQHAADAGAPR